MGKYAELVSKFEEDYEKPVIPDYVVGYSGIDPDRKIKPEEINHEKLDGLLGGDFAGRYHVTNDELTKFREYDSRITQVKNDTTSEFAAVRRETTAGLTSVREEASRNIETLRQSAYGKIDELSNKCNTEISRVEREAAQALNNKSTELGTKIQAVDDKTVRDIAAHKQEVNGSVSSIAGEVRTFTAQAGNTIAEVSRRNEEISAEQAQMTGRFNAALSALTSDSEVIDGRVSLDGTEYATLGGHIRAIENVSQRGLGNLHERDAGLWDAVQEVSGETASTMLEMMSDLSAEETERKKADDELRQDISAGRQELERAHRHLQAQSDELSGLAQKHEFDIKELAESHKDEVSTRERETAVIRSAQESDRAERARADEEILREISQTRKNAAERGDYLQEQAGTLAGEVLRLEYQRQEDIEGLRLDITNNRKISEYGQEHLQEQSDELAGAVLDSAIEIYGIDKRLKEETETRKSDTRYLTGEIAGEARERLLSDNELRADITASRKGTQAVYEQMREEADTLSGEVLRQMFEREELEVRTTAKITHEHEQRTARDEHSQEQANDLASGILSNAQNIAQEIDDRRKLAASVKEQISDWENKRSQGEKRMREGLNEVLGTATEAASDNAAAILRIAFEVIENRREQKRYQEEIRSRNNRISEWISGLQEQINELAYLKLSDLKSEYDLEDRLSSIEEDLDAITSELDPSDIATDDEADEAIEDVFSTATAVEVEPEFEEVADDIFGVNP